MEYTNQQLVAIICQRKKTKQNTIAVCAQRHSQIRLSHHRCLEFMEGGGVSYSTHSFITHVHPG